MVLLCPTLIVCFDAREHSKERRSSQISSRQLYCKGNGAVWHKAYEYVYRVHEKSDIADLQLGNYDLFPGLLRGRDYGL